MNSLVRKYNGLAPYSVRRSYYVRSVELEKAFKDAGPDILRGIEERSTKLGFEVKGNMPRDSEKSGVETVGAKSPWSILDVIRDWLSKLSGRWS